MSLGDHPAGVEPDRRLPRHHVAPAAPRRSRGLIGLMKAVSCCTRPVSATAPEPRPDAAYSAAAVRAAASLASISSASSGVGAVPPRWAGCHHTPGGISG